MQEFRDGDLLITRAGPLGPFANNAYLIADSISGDAWVIDAPQEVEAIFPALDGLQIRGIVITHRHGDHWAGVDSLVARTGAPVYCHAEDASGRTVAAMLADGEDIPVGTQRMQVIHTPGHTPGSICLLAGDHLFSGDTLFPGGPGRTQRNEDLLTEIESIKARLFPLPESTLVHPGHGDDTTIADSKREYAVFAGKQHPPDLAGDVTWLGS
jgi:hydroxyacylglutathione hydrolase